jgi:opacity protein-like surface antigen
MSALLQDVWLLDVEAEYEALMGHSRDVAVDVGDQFRSFELLVEVGGDANARPIERAGSANVYVLYGNSALMFYAIAGSQAAVVKWALVGTNHDFQVAQAQALQRAAQRFP